MSHHLHATVLSPYHAIPHLFSMSINRGDLLKALREKYFGDAEANAEVISDWKPDEVHDVKAHTWEQVSFNRLPPIFVVSIN